MVCAARLRCAPMFSLSRRSGMLKFIARLRRSGLARFAVLIGVAGALAAALVAPAQAQQTTSASCAAVNSGAFTVSALSPVTSSSLTAWNVGDALQLTLRSTDATSRIDGLWSASFAAVSTTTVPTSGTAVVNYTVTPGGKAGGILVDPEGDDTITATCTAAAAPTISSVSPPSGPTTGGTSVTITGTGFNTNPATAVTFGGTAATFSINSDTSITAAAPAHAAGTVVVAVTTPTGTATGSFTYVAPPTVTAVSPNGGPLAGGTPVTISGTNFTGATAVNFGTNVVSFTVVNATSITAVSPAGTGTVNVTVTTAVATSATRSCGSVYL